MEACLSLHIPGKEDKDVNTQTHIVAALSSTPTLFQWIQYMHNEVETDSPAFGAAGRLSALLRGIGKLHCC